MLSVERCQEIAETFPLKPGEGLKVKDGTVVIRAVLAEDCEEWAVRHPISQLTKPGEWP